MHKNPVGSLSIIASKNYSIEPFFKAVSNVFKIISFQIENLYRKSKSLFNYNKFLVLQILINENINIKNREKKAKFMQKYHFSTFYTTLSHDKLIKKLCNVLDFVFEGGNRTHICISKNNVAYWGEKSKDNIAFSKSTLKTSLKHLIENCLSMVGNSLLRQKIGIPIGIYPGPFWANLFSYTHENEYTSELISNEKVDKHFIDDIGTLNDRAVFNYVRHSPVSP